MESSVINTVLMNKVMISSAPSSSNSWTGIMRKQVLGFTTSLAVIAGLLLTLFCTLVRYDKEAQTDEHVQRYYMWYIHVAIMVFVGFGFLMTYLKQYSYSAVSLNFLTSCLVIVEAVVMVGLAQQKFWGDAQGFTVRLNLPLLIDATFCAASGMITFGAVLGKASPVQLLWLLVLGVPVYAANQQLLLSTLKVLDVGGSLTIHVFGAYYGLAASMVICKPGMSSSHQLNSSSYLTNITSTIGTLFLWIYWPSFNGALASVPGSTHPSQQFNCVLNTMLSLCGACITTFLVSKAVSGKCHMMHVQNATLAGGVAIGAAANLGVAPGFPLAVGAISGGLSTLGFTHIAPWLEARTGLTDTCGVHNLHGMPGLLAALVAAVASAWSYDEYSHLLARGRLQPGYEILGALVTLGIAATWGTLVGIFLNKVIGQGLEVEEAYSDQHFWHGPLASDPASAGSDPTWDTKVPWNPPAAYLEGGPDTENGGTQVPTRSGSIEAPVVAMGPLQRWQSDNRVSGADRNNWSQRGGTDALSPRVLSPTTSGRLLRTTPTFNSSRITPYTPPPVLAVNVAASSPRVASSMLATAAPPVLAVNVVASSPPIASSVLATAAH